MTFIHQLRDLLQQPLPHRDIRAEGLDSTMLSFVMRQQAAAEEGRKKHPPRPCGVLILLYPKQHNWHTSLIVRPTESRTHAGQLAFPGGKQETQDVDLCATALRETWEEVGVQVPPQNVIGALSPVYIPPSNTMVTPYIAHLATPPLFDPQPAEVAMIVEPQLTTLADAANARTKTVTMPTGDRFPLPAFQVGTHLIWGGTARMITELNKLVVQTTLIA
ncbi:MAG: CoA pyrophosphatase [Bacteroidota bacterium]